ncbi:MAG: transpeptidase family protein [Bacteroidales bacterium]|nr:transpeptidase family protein [Bacteroidales bacterium]
MKDIKKDILWRVYLLYFGVLLFGLSIIGKVIYIQFVEGKELIKKAELLDLKYFNIEAVRGNICASDASLLATSIPIFNVRMDVSSPLITDKLFYNNVESLANNLAKLFRDKSKQKYKRNLLNERKKGNRYYLLKRNVTYDELKKMRSFPILKLGKYKGGMIVIPKNKREKPFKLLAERTIGYENKKEKVFVGLEGAFSEYLSGVNGKQLKQRISNGDWKPVYDENAVEPENGKDIITTIDINIQDVAEDALMRHLEEHKADWGCAVLMEVQTGYIKAIANLRRDTINNNYTEAYNYAVGESIEPGSTFKLASMLAVLEDKKINMEDTIDIGNGIVKYYNLEIKDVYPIRDGKITVKEAFEKSSNVGISKIIYNAYVTKPEKFVDHLYDMSLNKPLNIEIHGEGKPVIKNTDYESWSKVSLPFMSIGYEIRMTPLQLLTFYNAIANNGRLVKPIFVKEIQVAGKTIETFEPVVINKAICSKATIEKVRELLEGVVENGTAQKLNRSVYKIAGKTGTAQIANQNKGYDKENYNASFVGYFPANNPRYSCIVVVSKPSTGKYYASSVAVPVFKEIADKVYATQLDIHFHDENIYNSTYIPLYTVGEQDEIKNIYKILDFPIDSLSSNSEWVVALESNNSVRLGTRIIKEDIVPNVKGMGVKDAVFILESLGLHVKIKGKGFVKNQSKTPGTIIKKGSEIILNLSIS